MSKKVILYQNFYIDKFPERQAELEACLLENITCPEIDEIVLLCHPDTIPLLEGKYKSDIVRLVSWAKRPTYNDFLMLFKDEEAFHVIANTDIYLTDTLALLKERGMKPGDCYALSRYDRLTDGSMKPHHCRGSQDVWIFSKPPKVVPGADFTLGIPGCDNVFAHLLVRKGYRVLNPCKDIKIVHVHNTGIRHYVKDTDRLPPPYFLVYPINLRQA